jgi:chlorobactene glucosyltransferase
MMILALLVSGALLLMLAIVVYNALWLPRLAPVNHDWFAETSSTTHAAPITPPVPAVSLLIPARNEAAVIGATVQMLLNQAYPRFELIVLDDGSTDDTALMAWQAGAGDERFSVRTGATLPPGWLGKNWACHQLSQLAHHDVLIFTDADVGWQPDALAALVAHLQTSRADLLTIWPTQTTETWGERLVVPLMSLAVLAYLPVGLAHHTPYPLAAAANGQCLVFPRQAYLTCGGHQAVRNEIIEDVRLAQRIKRSGMHLRMADGAGLLQTRMYRSWPETRAGFAKNILAGHGNSRGLLIASTLFHLLVFVGPWLWLLAGSFGFLRTGWPLWPLVLLLTGLAVRMLAAAVTRQRLVDAVWLPVSVLLMTWVAGQALWWRYRAGGPIWKGRLARAG